MNVRLGFARLARVVAISYALGAVVTVSLMTTGAWNYRQQDLHPSEWLVTADDGRQFTIKTYSEYEGLSAAQEWARENPRPRLSQPTSADPYATVAAPLLPTIGPPVRLHLPRYEHPRSLGSVLWAALVPAFWFVIAYIALLLVFRAIRWVLLGFMDEPKPESAT